MENLTMNDLFKMGDKAIGKTLGPFDEYTYAFGLTQKTTKTVLLDDEYTIHKSVKLYNEAKGKRKASYYLLLKGKKDFYSMFLNLDEKINLKFV